MYKLKNPTPGQSRKRGAYPRRVLELERERGIRAKEVGLRPDPKLVGHGQAHVLLYITPATISLFI